mmetsp:Transcript_33020/g.48209  ORF Transcript_33020/g.48209 Transcript_33020/m.48209 type:complete len:332 (-) Transcript_33020:262-1257(-)
MKSDDIISSELEREKEKAAGKEDISAGAGCAAASSRFMIAGEAPVLLGKACEFLIKELTARAWRHTERNRRRTLQRQDVHAAVGESEVYDFLIDIVPRVPQQGTQGGAAPPQTATGAAYNTQGAEQVTKEGAAPAPGPPPGPDPSTNSNPAPAVSVPTTAEQAGGIHLTDELRLAQFKQMQEQYAVMMQHRIQQAGDPTAVPGLPPAAPAPPAPATPAPPPGTTPHPATVGLAPPQTMGLYVQHPGQDPAIQWTHQAALAYTSQQQQQHHQQHQPPQQQHIQHPQQQQAAQQSQQQSYTSNLINATPVTILGTAPAPNNGTLTQQPSGTSG